MTTIYEIAATLSESCADGRDFSGVWGHEGQFHPSRTAAEAAVGRLRDGGHWGCSSTPEYEVVERTRADFPDDAIGEQEWRRACQQAGVSPRL